VLVALLAAVVLGEAGPVGVAGVAGTYRVVATVEIDSPGLPEHHELRADVVLGPWPGSAPGALSVTLASAGHRCTLAARIDRAGAMELAAGQRCRIALQEEAVSGTVDCTLRVGRGQVRGGRLSLELGADLRGLLRLGPGAGLGLTGLEFLAPQLPVRGRAVAKVEGRRDESRHR